MGYVADIGSLRNVRLGYECALTMYNVTFICNALLEKLQR